MIPMHHCRCALVCIILITAQVLSNMLRCSKQTLTTGLACYPHGSRRQRIYYHKLSPFHRRVHNRRRFVHAVETRRSLGLLVSYPNIQLSYQFNGCIISRQKVVRKSEDSTFVFLAILWSALYAWDEALEVLYEHFCWLVSTPS